MVESLKHRNFVYICVGVHLAETKKSSAETPIPIGLEVYSRNTETTTNSRGLNELLGAFRLGLFLDSIKGTYLGLGL
jgi:hypothetical protein